MERQEKIIDRSTVEVLEKLYVDLEKEEKTLLGAENPDEALSYNRGIYTALSRIEETIAKLSDMDSENYVNYHYRNRTIHINREKFMERRPDRNDIDRWIRAWFLQGQPALNAKNMPEPEPDELADQYSVEEIEHIVSHYLDIEVQDSDYYWKKYTQKEENKLRKQGIEVKEITLEERIERAKMPFNP